MFLTVMTVLFCGLSGAVFLARIVQNARDHYLATPGKIILVGWYAALFALANILAILHIVRTA